MKLQTLKGKTSKLVEIFIQDSSSTVGAGLTGLVFNSSSLTGYYYRSGAASAVSITLATMTAGTWATGGFVAVDGTNMPGLYQLGIPDAALATGASQVVIMLKGATNMAPVVLEIQLVNYDPDDAVRMGLTALPNAAAEAAGGLYTRGTGAGQINQDANGRVDTNVKTWLASTPNVLISGRVDSNVQAMATGVIAAATFTAGAIDAAAIAANAITSSEFAASAQQAVADTLLGRNIGGGSSTGRIVKWALAVMVDKVDISAGAMTVYDTDDTTPLFTAAVTTAAGNPISQIDPA